MLILFLLASGGRIVRAEIIAVTFHDGKVMKVNCTCIGSIIDTDSPDLAANNESEEAIVEPATEHEVPTEDLAREVTEAISECLVDCDHDSM